MTRASRRKPPVAPDTAAAERRWHQRLVATFRTRPGVTFGIVAAVAVFLALSGTIGFSSRLLAGWNAGAVVYLAMALRIMLRSDPDRMRERAIRHDEGEAMILVLVLGAAVASLVAIAAELQAAKSGEGAVAAARVALAGVTIIVSWLVVQTVLALHYAHDFYLKPEHGDGLVFPEQLSEPDYWDFLYFSVTIGATSQTSDVLVNSQRMRRVVLAHTVLSFLFNTSILALAINVGASLL